MSQLNMSSSNLSSTMTKYGCRVVTHVGDASRAKVVAKTGKYAWHCLACKMAVVNAEKLQQAAALALAILSPVIQAYASGEESIRIPSPTPRPASTHASTRSSHPHLLPHRSAAQHAAPATPTSTSHTPPRTPSAPSTPSRAFSSPASSHTNVECEAAAEEETAGAADVECEVGMEEETEEGIDAHE
jgi:hypothetical protein